MKLRFAAAALAALALSATPLRAADLKLATVNLKKTFDDYWKTKQADKILKEDGEALQTRYNGMMEDLKKSADEYRKLLEAAADTAISETERAKRKKTAEDKERNLKDMDNALKTWMRSADAQVQEKKRNLREKILTEIRSYIEARAKAGGFIAVLDSSSESLSNAPILLYNGGLTDLTDELLKQLNATAPPPTPEPPAKTGDLGTKPVEPVAKPIEKK